MKITFIILSAFTAIGICTSITTREDDSTLKLPLVFNDVKNTYNSYFDEKPIECLKWKIKLNNVNNVDKKWLEQHGGKKLLLTKDNMTIKIGNETFESNKIYDLIENQDVTIYNLNDLVFKTTFHSFKNMMSYADNEYSFLYIPITIKFFNCN